jgi:hypothetical protein
LRLPRFRQLILAEQFPKTRLMFRALVFLLGLCVGDRFRRARSAYDVASFSFDDLGDDKLSWLLFLRHGARL